MSSRLTNRPLPQRQKLADASSKSPILSGNACHSEASSVGSSAFFSAAQSRVEETSVRTGSVASESLGITSEPNALLSHAQKRLDLVAERTKTSRIEVFFLDQNQHSDDIKTTLWENTVVLY
jgi:hypothetical protein